MKKLKVGILGATGMVGQRFVTLLNNHPWFNVVLVAASPSSAGKTYAQAVQGRWWMKDKIPQRISKLKLYAVKDDLDVVVSKVDMVFCALNMDKKEIQHLENTYASAGVPVISNNSAHRWTDDVPMVMPEINAHHTKLIDIQRKRRGWTTGLIAVKPNCSIQSYVTILTALKKFGPKDVEVVSLQAISGAGRTFQSWPEMVDNVNPYIAREEEKSEQEPMRIWGKITGKKIVPAKSPHISATCIRVSVSDGHMASVSVNFTKKSSKKQFLTAIETFNRNHSLATLHLPSSPKKLITYFEQDDRPQTRLDRDIGKGMGISFGRLRETEGFDWKFVALSHNTIRGAAGGGILTAEYLYKTGYINTR